MDLDGFGKNVSMCLFKYWISEDARELTCVLAKLISTPNPNLKRRGPTRHHPSLEQILLHLNQFYKWCQDNNSMSLFKYENLRYEIRQAKGKITDMDVKTKCKPLFAEFTELLPGRVNRKRKNQRLTRSGRGGGNRGRKDESSDESESEDEPIEEDIKGKENDVNEDDEDMHVNHANEWDFEDKEGEKKDPLLPEIAKNLLTTVDRLSKVPLVSNLLEAVIPPELAPKQNALGARSFRPGWNGMGLMGMMKFYDNMKTIGVAMTSVGLTALEMTDLSISVLDNLPFGIQVPEVVKFLEHAYDFMDFGVEMMDMMI